MPPKNLIHDFSKVWSMENNLLEAGETAGPRGPLELTDASISGTVRPHYSWIPCLQIHVLAKIYL